jgi:curved DNA-binding protein CbpA
MAANTLKEAIRDYLAMERQATSEEITRAFRRLALQYHPDHNPQNVKVGEEKFKEINEAYEVLGDESKRRQYEYLTSHMQGWTELALNLNLRVKYGDDNRTTVTLE